MLFTLEYFNQNKIKKFIYKQLSTQKMKKEQFPKKKSKKQIFLKKVN